ncbi:MAG: glycine--tRNA ligase subunit beta [Bryobacteraceae bacterium]|nr:glycine--tRNA ligase subunit beta [Bryobacteraceae bacterium]
MSGVPFLLEIGTEEIPDWMILPALDDLRRLFEKVLADHALAGSVSWVDATPRRLVLRADGLSERQADREELVTGPPVAAAAGAVAGFAKKQNVVVESLERVETAKGVYYGVRKQIAGRATAEILAAALPEVIAKIYFPKTMYWTGKGGLRFIRPIRWIVALLGHSVVPFEVAGVAAGDTTSGHRRMGSAQIGVTIESYKESLRANGVLLHAAERRQKLERELAALAAGAGLRIHRDEALLDTLVYLTEFPTPILGSFDPSYLELPREVLITVMRHHQRYFSLETPDGSLAPNFLAVMNTAADPEGLVRQGNERVLRARFNDARFFWQQDQQKPLAARIDDLKNVTFQAKLGSYYEKAQRMTALVRELGGDAHAERAALLAKCDLTCEMVKEFTELQGVVGGLYARAQGEPEDVAGAVYDHYKPESMDDAIPRGRTAQIVALADKLDTLRGCFKIGLVPTGSKDPFALRRAAQGVVRILAEGEVAFALPVESELGEFFRDRIDYYFREVRKFPYDEVRAGMSAGFSDVRDLAARLEAVHAVRPTADFEPLAASFKRIKNILRQAQYEDAPAPGEALLEPGPERELYEAYAHAKAAIAGLTSYRDRLERIAALRPQVDLFFDKVLVNAPDPRVRANRLALLSAMLGEFSRIADLSEIVTASSSVSTNT